MADYSDLIERLERATGAGYEADCDIYIALNPKARKTYVPGVDELVPHVIERHWPQSGVREIDVPNYTRSFDAALTVVPAGFATTVTHADGMPGHAMISPKPGDGECWSSKHAVKATHPTSAVIALVIAALRARQSNGESR